MLKSKIANNLRHLDTIASTTDRCGLRIDTVDLRNKIKAYKAYFDLHFPNKTSYPDIEQKAKHASFNREAEYRTPSFHMGISK